jgi:hypothetical protein
MNPAVNKNPKNPRAAIVGQNPLSPIIAPIVAGTQTSKMRKVII